MTRPSQLKTDFAKALQASGYTRKQFVTLSGYSPSTVEKFCSGERACPPGHRAFKMLHLLKSDIDLNKLYIPPPYKEI